MYNTLITTDPSGLSSIIWRSRLCCCHDDDDDDEPSIHGDK